jgi:hypothetical protein
MARMLIPCKGGTHYLFRLRIIQTPWFGIYLHDIFEPDADRHPHNHPWSFVSIVLRGSYVEMFHPAPWVHPDCNKRLQVWKRFSMHRMGADSAHRIIEAGPRLKTLILTGPRKKNWGFFTENGFEFWQDYEKE